MEYNYSFSGADCDVWAYKNGSKAFLHLKTIATLSTSVYESKSPVRRLGRAGVVGYTGATRTIAGSMIFILTGEHPLKELHAKNDRKYMDSNPRTNSTLSGVIAPFNMLIILSNEVGESMMYRLEGVEVVSEGIVTSANDMTSELVIQFVATDMLNIRKHTLSKTKKEEVKEDKKETTRKARKEVISLTVLNKIVNLILKDLEDLENLSFEDANKKIRSALSNIPKGSITYKHIDIFLNIFTGNNNGGEALIETFSSKYDIYSSGSKIDINVSRLVSLKERYEEVTF